MSSITTGMRIPRGGGFRRAIALLGVVAATTLASASAASALPPIDPDGDPPLPPDRPNLVFTAASVAPSGTADWELSYTVANRGSATAGSFRVAARQNGAATIKETAHGSLAPGASRSETIHLARTGCYMPVSFTADTTHTVAES